jgi:HTH-type transcriptional repressor of NAD biosynthesis genes
LICSTTSEPISGLIRFDWIKEFYKNDERIKPVHIVYDENDLPNTSVSSREVSQKWADFLKTNFSAFDVVFTSEKYGDYLAKFLEAVHIPFNLRKNIVPVSGTLINHNPFRYWDYLPDVVKPYFVKKICLVGTESTGKSVLTEKLAKHFNTVFVAETAREIVEKTAECLLPEHLRQIAERHAAVIIEKTKIANRLLFADTDLNITKSYSRFLFSEELKTEKWIEEANRFDLYLYLDKRIEFVQDGTRLEKNERDLLDAYHRKFFAESEVNFVEIGGTWEERFQKSVTAVNDFINQTNCPAAKPEDQAH